MFKRLNPLRISLGASLLALLAACNIPIEERIQACLEKYPDRQYLVPKFSYGERVVSAVYEPDIIMTVIDNKESVPVGGDGCSFLNVRVSANTPHGTTIEWIIDQRLLVAVKE